jgi:hypothetical protein
MSEVNILSQRSFLGVNEANSVEMVHFWPNNIPYGFGEKAVPKAKIASVIFSRLQNAQNIQRALYTLSPRNVYLGSLIRKDSSLAEALQQDLRSPVRLAPA